MLPLVLEFRWALSFEFVAVVRIVAAVRHRAVAAIGAHAIGVQEFGRARRRMTGA